MTRRSSRAAFFALALGSSIVGCANPAYRAAERGDRQRLEAEIKAKHEKGKLSNGEAECLARAVATRELTTAKSEAEGVTRIKEVRSCALELDDALEDLMKRHDAVGAEAALARVDDGKLSNGSARDYLTDADDRWRAVGTRTLHRDQDQKKRRDAILDPSPRVRRSALRASAEAKDPGDIDLLFETARVDPELMLRNEALRSISAILRDKDDAEGKKRAADAAMRLRDLWTSGDDAIREDIAVAWALAPVFDNGGREALRVQIAVGKGTGAIAAAGVVLRTAPKDAELTASASALLTRLVLEGSRRERAFAIASARASGPELEALRKVAKEDDYEVRVAALSRLLDSKPDRDAAIKELEIVAGQGLKAEKDVTPREERMRDHAARARLALAYAGDARIQAWVERDLTSPDPHRRLGAASALAALGRQARAAPLLADPDASVRTRAACTMLVASRH